MYFDSWQAAWAMDGHGAFVWASVAITLLVLTVLLLWPGMRYRRLLRRESRRRLRERMRSEVS